MNTYTQKRKIANDHIIKPASDKWGSGWRRLSFDQKLVEVKAAMWDWVFNGTPHCERIESAMLQDMWHIVRKEVNNA